MDKCRVAYKKQTNQQTNRQTNTHCSFIGIDELTKVGSDQRSSTIQYDSKSKHSKCNSQHMMLVRKALLKTTQPSINSMNKSTSGKGK